MGIQRFLNLVPWKTSRFKVSALERWKVIKPHVNGTISNCPNCMVFHMHFALSLDGTQKYLGLQQGIGLQRIVLLHRTKATAVYECT